MKTAIELIEEERNRQITVEGFTPEHDDRCTGGELNSAALAYALHADTGLSGTECSAPDMWPWDDEWWKPSNDPVRNLVKAGALIAAEIDRLQRESAQTGHFLPTPSP